MIWQTCKQQGTIYLYFLFQIIWFLHNIKQQGTVLFSYIFGSKTSNLSRLTNNRILFSSAFCSKASNLCGVVVLKFACIWLMACCTLVPVHLVSDCLQFVMFQRYSFFIYYILLLTLSLMCFHVRNIYNQGVQIVMW